MCAVAQHDLVPSPVPPARVKDVRVGARVVRPVPRLGALSRRRLIRFWVRRLARRLARTQTSRVSRVACVVQRTQRTERLAAERRPDHVHGRRAPRGRRVVEEVPHGTKRPGVVEGHENGSRRNRAPRPLPRARRSEGKRKAQVFKRGERSFVRRTHIRRGALGDRDGLRRLQRLDFRIGPARQKVIPARELLHVRAPARPRALGRLV